MAGATDSRTGTTVTTWFRHVDDDGEWQFWRVRTSDGLVGYVGLPVEADATDALLVACSGFLWDQD